MIPFQHFISRQGVDDDDADAVGESTKRRRRRRRICRYRKVSIDFDVPKLCLSGPINAPGIQAHFLFPFITSSES